MLQNRQIWRKKRTFFSGHAAKSGIFVQIEFDRIFSATTHES